MKSGRGMLPPPLERGIEGDFSDTSQLCCGVVHSIQNNQMHVIAVLFSRGGGDVEANH